MVVITAIYLLIEKERAYGNGYGSNLGATRHVCVFGKEVFQSQPE
jgi:hypothetical protein